MYVRTYVFHDNACLEYLNRCQLSVAGLPLFGACCRGWAITTLAQTPITGAVFLSCFQQGPNHSCLTPYSADSAIALTMVTIYGIIRNAHVRRYVRM